MKVSTRTTATVFQKPSAKTINVTSKRIRKIQQWIFFVLIGLLVFPASDFGQAFTGTYNFSGVTISSGLTDPTAVPTATGVTFGSFTAVGQTTANPNAGSRFSFTGQPTGATNASDVFSGSLSTTQYYQVTLTVASGFNISLSSITFTIQRSATGIRQYAVRSSADSYAANLPASVSNAALSVVPTNVFQITDATTTATTGSTVTLSGPSFTNISVGSTISFRFYGFNAEAAGGTFSIDDVAIIGSASPGASISVTGTPLSAVNTTYGTASASPTSFSVSGANLTADILVTPPAGYEVSQTAGGASGYAATQTLTQTAGVVTSTLIYARLQATANVAGSPYAGNIVLSTTGVNPSVNVATVSSTVSPLAINTTGAAAVNKVYDRTNAASITGATTSEAVNADAITITGGGTFADFLVGNTKPVTAALTVSGTNASSYTVIQPTGLTANITEAPLTISGAQAQNKVFDGNTDAVITGTLNGVLSPDVVTFSGTGTFASSAVGNGIAVTSTSTLGGADAANYSLTQPTGLTANITSAGLTPQTITFTLVPATATYGDATITLNGTASSGLTVSYTSSDPAVATVSGNILTITGPGTTTITAQQAGNGTFDVAPDVPQSLTVAPKILTVTGATAQNKVYDGNTSATITGASLVEVIIPDVVTVGGGGTFADANVAGGIAVTANLTLGGTDAFKYTLTQPTGLSADITQASQTINFGALAPKAYGDVPFTLNGTATSGLTVTYTSSDPLVATVSGNTITVVGIGTTTITAQQAGNINYAAATDVPQSLVVGQASQLITFAALPNKLTTDAPFALTASSSSGLLIAYNSSNPAVATVSGSTLTIVGAGTTTITASQSGNANYAAALPVQQTQSVILALPFAPVVISTQPGKSFTENFSDIADWGNAGLAFNAGAGANHWKSVGTSGTGIPNANVITTATTAFVSGTSGGVQKGSSQTTPTTPDNTIVLLSTGTTDNTTSTAIDFFMDFTGELADKVSFDVSTYVNAATGPRSGTLRVYASTDGTTWTELTGTNLPYVTTNAAAAGPLPVSVQLPASFNGSATARLRFYYHNGGLVTAASGNRPKIAIDNLTVTALIAPVINSSLTATATVGLPFTYTITALNSPSGFSSATLPVNGLIIAGAVISGTPTTAGLQNVAITASNAAGSDNQTLAITVAKGNQVITGLPLNDTRTYGDANYNLTATGGASGNAVTYISSNPAVATVSGSTVTITGTGTTTITASQAGDANYNAAPDVAQSLTVNKANQTITFGPLPNKLDTDIPYNLTATASSGLTVSYISSNLAVATISGNTVTIVGPGNTTITASQAGDVNYNAAPDVSQNQLVINTNLTPQVITFGPLSNKTYGDPAFQLTATGGGSPNPVTYVSSNTAVATISGDIVTIVASGTTNITASQAGDLNYNPATDVTQPFTVDPKALTVTGATAQNKVYDGNTSATITGASLVGVIIPDVVTVGGGGTFADANVAAGIAVTANLTLGGADAFKYSVTQPTGLSADITQASQTITFGALPTKTAADAPFTLNGTATSGLTVTYTSSDPLVATVTGNTVTIVGIGSTIITAFQAGNTNYAAATPVPQTLTVSQGSQTITFAALPAKLTTDPPFTLTATASSGLTVSYASSNPAVATVSGNTVTIVGAGSTNITASQPGNVNFTAATPVVRALTVTQPFAPVVMSAQPLRSFTENFNDITNWLNGFTGGTGADHWLPVATGGSGTIPNPAIMTAQTNTFATGATGGVQRGSAQTVPTTSIVLLSTGGSPDNTSSAAIDFYMDFTGLIADKFSCNATTVFNGAAADNRTGTLHVYASVNGTTWTELTGTNLPYLATNNVASTVSISNIQLPAIFNNSATARLRFYYHNGTGGSSGSRPKISIDNVSVSAVNAPVITSSLTDNGTVNTSYSYTITATNTPTSYNATGLAPGLNFSGNIISGTATTAGTFNITIEATNAGGTDSKILVLTIAKADQAILGLAGTDTRTYGDAAYNLTATGGGSGQPVTYASSNPAVATISGNTVTITGGGVTTITASQAGDANYNAAPDVTQTLTVNKANQTITFGALPNKLDTDPAFALTATASSGLTVSYLSSNPAVAIVSGNTVTIVGPGTTNITASQAGDANYNAAPDVIQSQLVINSAAANQTITFNALPNQTYGDPAFQLTATASSNLPVSYASSNPAVATVSGDMVTIVGPGTTNITASQPGDFINYNPAPDVIQPFTVDPKALTVTGATAQNKPYDGNTTATITGASLAGVINPDVVTVGGGGTFADANVAAGIAVAANLTLGGADAFKYTLTQPAGLSADITQASQAITFGALAPKTTADAPFALTASASSGLTVTYSSSNPAVATVSGNTVTIVSDGSTIITASQAGNTNYAAAVPVQQTLLVTPAASVVMWHFGTTSGNASPSSAIPPGLTVSIVTQNNNNGTTTMLSNTSASNTYLGASGQFNAAAATIDGSLGAKAATSTYFEFTLTPAFHKRVIVNAVSFGSRSTATGPTDYSVRSSLDAFSTDITSGTTATTSTWGLRNAATTTTTSNYGSPVTYRIYGYGGTGAAANAANWRIDDLSLSLLLESAPPCSGTPDAGTAAAGGNNFCLSGSTTLTLTGYTDPGTVDGITLQWYSSTDNVSFNPISLETNPTLATGTITQTTYYYCVVSCSASGLSATSNTVTVVVNQAVNAGTVSGPTTLCIGATSTYTSNGDAGGTWSSINPLVATVNASSGLVTVIGAGSTDITYTVVDCTGPVSAFETLSVSADVVAGTVTGTANLCVGSTATYNSDGDLGGTWSSSDGAVASVDAFGEVTAIGAGTATITYTISSGCGSPVSGSQAVTVNAVPAAPSVGVVNNIDGTSTLTATGFTGSLLWSPTNETTPSITVAIAGIYTVTQTVNGCTSLPGSGLAAPTVVTDPAVTGLDLTDLADVSIPNANATPFNQVLKLKVPVFNLNQENAIPAGSTTLRIDLGSKFIVDPGFTLATASLDNYFNWTQTIEGSNVVIYGDQYAAIPADFDGIASFQVIANKFCSSVITANIILDNHASVISAQDEDAANNIASLNYIIVVPVPVVSVVQPTCSVPGGTITITSPTAPGMTYSIDGVTYTNTTGVFNVLSGSYNVTAKTIDGCISAITVAVVDPQPSTPTTITYNVTQPDCVTSTGTITVTSPVGPGLTYSIDGLDYSNTTGVFAGLTAGSYNLTVAPVAGCVSNITVVVIDAQPVFTGTIVYNVDQPTCATQTGTITITSPTAVGMTYSVDGLDYSNTTGIFTGLAPNTSYNLTVKTSGGCISPITIATVNAAPAVPTIILGTVQSTGCSGSPVGSISVTGGGAPGLTYTIAGPTVNTTGQFSGTFTSLSAGDYVVTVTSTSGCSNSVAATVVGPTGIVPDISLGADFSGNFFFAPGDIQTVVYNVSEIAGNPATGDTIRVTKVPGYVITFNGALTANPLGVTPLDNPRWKINSSNPSFVSLIFDPLQNNVPGTLNCGERVFIAINIQRNTPNISIFSLSARLRRANTETYLPNNLNSILFTAE